MGLEKESKIRIFEFVTSIFEARGIFETAGEVAKME